MTFSEIRDNAIHLMQMCVDLIEINPGTLDRGMSKAWALVDVGVLTYSEGEEWRDCMLDAYKRSLEQ